MLRTSSAREVMSWGAKRRGSVDLAVFREILEQFVASPWPSPGEIEQFEALALGFIDALDAESVASFALALCRCPDTPPAVIARLIKKGGGGAGIALRCAPSVSLSDLLSAAEHGPAELAEAIASRADLQKPLAVMLAARGEPCVLRALAANKALRLDPSPRRALALAGRDDPSLARLLLDRDDLDFSGETLFLAATADERARMIVAASARVLAEGAPESGPPEHPAATQLAGLAARRDADGLIDLLARSLDCRESRIRAIAADKGGEALALLLLASGAGEETAIRALLCFHPALAGAPERVRSFVALMRSVPRRAARRLIAAMTGARRAEKDLGRRERSEGPAPAAGRKESAKPARSRKLEQAGR